MVLSTPVPYSALFEQEEEEAMTVSETLHDGVARMTARQHLRALAHWLAPWDEETREMVAIASVFYVGGLFLAVLFRNWDLVAALTSIYWFFAKLFLVLHCLALAGWIGIMRIQGKGVWGNLRLAWREAGEEVLFPNLMRGLALRRYKRRSEARVKK